MSYRIGALVCLLVAAQVLCGCDSFYRAIGKEKVVPDEFAVVQRAPLAVPPDFDLRPPRLGAARPQEESPADQARQAVFRLGDDAKDNLPPAASRRSPGEGELLKEAGAANVSSNIRQLLAKDNTTGDVSPSLVDRLAFWRKNGPAPADRVVNPVAETERLKARSDEAQSPTASTAAVPVLAAAPSIERTQGSGSSSWFGWIGSIF
ncbi:MAG: DUF3035 domain-containing protein [Stellaceae bacterium]